MRGQREGQPALPSLGGSVTAGWSPLLPLGVAMGHCKGSSQPKGLMQNWWALREHLWPADLRWSV